jgi:hypothetical protein
VSELRCFAMHRVFGVDRPSPCLGNAKTQECDVLAFVRWEGGYVNATSNRLVMERKVCLAIAHQIVKRDTWLWCKKHERVHPMLVFVQELLRKT